MIKTRIREYRKQMKLTLIELGNRANVSPGYLCHLERGSRNNPSASVMNAICKVLNRDINEVFFMVDENELSTKEKKYANSSLLNEKRSDGNDARHKDNSRARVEKVEKNPDAV